MLSRRQLSPESFFLFTSLFFGILFIILTPPMQAPDEPNHFYRAWHIAEGNLNAVKADKRIGGLIPLAVPRLTRIMMPIHDYGPGFKYTVTQIRLGMEGDVKASDYGFVDFNNTALYSFTCYLPAATMLAVGKLFTGKVLLLFYLARLGNLLLWVALLFLSIRMIPFLKWGLCFLALIPMSVFINSSLSADVITTSAAVLFISYICRITTVPKLTKKHIVKLALLVVLVSSVKIVYSPILLLLLIIRPRQLSNPTRYFIFITSFLLLAYAAIYLWSLPLKELYLPYAEYNDKFRDHVALAPGADVTKQLEFFRSKGVGPVFLMVVSSIGHFFPQTLVEFAGNFGWLELQLPNSVVVLLYLALIAVVLTDKDHDTHIDLRLRLFFLCTFLILLFLVYLSQLLSWAPVNSERAPIQGRYLFPFVILLCLSLGQPFRQRRQPAGLITGITMLFALAYSAFMLHERYFY